MDTITLALGVDADWSISIKDYNGNIPPYTTADIPSAVIWYGDDTTPLATPMVSWIDSSLGTLKLSIRSADTASLESGKYSIRVILTTVEAFHLLAWEGYLYLADSPGESTRKPCYCSHEDLLTYYSRIGAHQDTDDQEGFYEQRLAAREWLDTAIVNAFPGALFAPMIGYNFNPSLGLFIGRSARSVYMQGLLDQDKLKITRQVVEITAKYALYLILSGALGPNDKDTAYQRLGDRYHQDAVSALRTFVAEIAPDSSGYSRHYVSLGIVNTRGV